MNKVNSAIKNIMATNSISLFNFLASSNLNQLVIPIFQRPYSWRIEQVEDFFNDVTPLLNNPKIKHFMGLVVLVNEETNNGSFEVIDGQQRLTTISLTLAVIRDFLDDLKENNINTLSRTNRTKIERTIQRIENCLIIEDRLGNRNLKLISKNERSYESKFLENVLISINDLIPTDIRAINYQDQPTGQKNTFEVKNEFMSNKAMFDQRTAKSHRSYRNFSIILDILNNDSFLGNCKTLDEKINFLCDSLTKAILDHIQIVDFISDNHSEAFNTFEVLNNRGLAISSTDLIKNICLKQAVNNTSDQEYIFKSWGAIFDQELNNTDDIQFLRYSNNSRRDFVTKSELYDTYHQIISNMNINELKSFLENDLLIDARIFGSLKDSVGNFTPTILNNVIKLLQTTKSNQWFSIAISAIRAHNAFTNINVSEKLKKLLEIVHEIIFCIILNDKKANLIEQRFPEIAKKIVGFKDAKELIEVYDIIIGLLVSFRDAESLRYAKINLNEVDFSSHNLNASMVLSFIEYHNGHGNLSIKSLEHILPQNPKEKQWTIINGISKDIIDNNIYSLGNMLLIEKPLNSKIKASSFSVKVKEYSAFKVFDPVGQSSVNCIKNISNFDFKSISDRNNELIEIYNTIVR